MLKNKAFIYIFSFCVSFLVIYSVYYYTRLPFQFGGITANADDLKRTIVNPTFKTEDTLNCISTTAFLKDSGGLPDSFSLSYMGPVNDHILDSLDERITTKIPKHPPLDFQDLKKGQNLNLCYLLRKVDLPSMFTIPIDKLRFKGTDVRALALKKNNKNISVKFSKNKKDCSVIVTLPETEEEVGWISRNIYIKYGLAKDSLLSVSLGKEDWIQLPMLDMFIMKNYARKDDSTLFSDTKNLYQERLKLMTNAPTEERPLGTEPLFKMNGDFIFYIKKMKDKKPYLFISVRNPEILVKP